MELKQTGLRVQGPEVADDNLAVQVAQVILRSLARRAAPDVPVTIDTPLSNCRLDSLAAARLVLELQCAYAVGVPMEWLAECGSIGSLATRIVEQIRSGKTIAVQASNGSSLPST